MRCLWRNANKFSEFWLYRRKALHCPKDSMAHLVVPLEAPDFSRVRVHYSNSMPIKVECSYSGKDKIRDELNIEFDRRVGSDFVQLYNLYDSKLNKPEK